MQTETPKLRRKTGMITSRQICGSDDMKSKLRTFCSKPATGTPKTAQLSMPGCCLMSFACCGYSGENLSVRAPGLQGSVRASRILLCSIEMGYDLSSSHQRGCRSLKPLQPADILVRRLCSPLVALRLSELCVFQNFGIAFL